MAMQAANVERNGTFIASPSARGDAHDGSSVPGTVWSVGLPNLGGSRAGGCLPFSSEACLPGSGAVV